MQSNSIYYVCEKHGVAEASAAHTRFLPRVGEIIDMGHDEVYRVTQVRHVFMMDNTYIVHMEMIANETN